MVKKNQMLYLVIFNLFLVFLGVGLVIPALPQLKIEMGFSGTVMGLLVSIFAFAQLVVSPISGHLSDKLGRKKLIVLGMLLFSISEIIFGFAQTLPWFYFSRLLGGASAALIMPSVTAFVTDLTTIEERPKSMGLVSAAISGGFIIGPGVGGALTHFGLRVPFFAAGLVAFIGFIISALILKEPEKHVHSDELEPTNAKKEAINLLKSPIFSMLFIIIFISSFGLQAFEAIYSVMATENFGFTVGQISIVITVGGIFALIFQLFIFEKLVNLIGELRLIQLTFFSSAIFIAFIAFTNKPWVVVASTFVIFLSFDLFRPAVTTYLSKHAGNNQGMVNGLNSTFTSVGNIVGPIVAGALFDVHHRSPYFVSAIILLVTGVLSLKLNSKKYQAGD
ncbi:MFS transporter [Vagococcus xieshaowenii]|uniref:MFS transporter n=1 Tax=Vagococcus xieshaowenii TaxID=2562451 RepID=A0AAJ5EH20_9ENTE|nr:MFS transporter [Vagococcus xieshaowenii]QCA28776.1 MFS transporter [Vagococcus xieshaowenii]TFZ43023.1 MFS transporter [Vagococcus xieshaowenii]